MSDSDVLFDASAFPDYAKARSKNLLVWNMIVIASIAVWPIIIASLYFLLPEGEFESGISKSTLIVILSVFFIVDIIFAIWMTKKFAGRSIHPIKITSQGVELSKDNVVLATEIVKVIIDTQGSVGLYKQGKGFPIRILSKGQLGNSEEFIKILRQQNPLIEIEDMNEMAKKYQAERKAKKEARKGL